MDDLVRLVDREHRLQPLALEGQLAVGVVLEDPEVVLGGELDQPHPLLGRERAAGRVVEVGNDVGELDRPLCQRGFEGGDVEPVVLERDRHQLDPEPLQHQQRAVVGRLLDHHPVPRPRAGARRASSRPPASRWRPSPGRRRAPRAAARPTRRGPDGRSRCRRRGPFPSPRQAPPPPRRAPRRAAGCRRSAPLSQTKSCRQPCESEPSNAPPSPTTRPNARSGAPFLVMARIRRTGRSAPLRARAPVPRRRSSRSAA